MFSHQEWPVTRGHIDLAPEERARIIERAHRLRAEALADIVARFRIWVGSFWDGLFHSGGHLHRS